MEACGPMTDQREALLQAALAHVAFDGWSDATFTAAVSDAGLDPGAARAACPRGHVDLAAAYHSRGDEAIVAGGLDGMRYSEKVAALVWRRVEAADREVVRKSMALFALPQHAAEGASLIWRTADTIWRTLGDTSDDVNWYSKRAILSGVLGTVFLFWLGDRSEQSAATRAFIDRRIADVMRFEKLKGNLRDNPMTRPLMSLQQKVLSGIRAPRQGPFPDYPGWLSRRRT